MGGEENGMKQNIESYWDCCGILHNVLGSNRR
jgi:hypothetical protein